MAKVEVDVLLKDGTDETAFINDVTSNTEVDLKDRLPSSPTCLLYTSPSPRDQRGSRMTSSA